jgi:hypothetical protein
MRLCANLGWRSVDELMAGMSPVEMQWWAGYLTHDRFPMERIEIAIAHLHCSWANMHRKKGAAPIKLGEFMLFSDAWEFKYESGNADLDEDVQKIIAALGSRVIVKKPGE